MEKHIEMSLAKKMTFTDRLLSLAASLLPMLISCYILVLVVSLKFSSFISLAVIICAVSLFASYKIFCSFNIDWEYIFIDDEIRFSKIINKNRRKELVTVNLSKAETVARINDSAHNRPLSDSGYKRYNFKSNTTDDCWFVAGLSSKGERICVVFEPDERMLEALKLTVRSRFFG